MGQMKTPGVYIVEKDAFPNSVVEVPTAVPAFIGHTEMAMAYGKSVLNKPTKISSLAEFESYFGGAPKPVFGYKKIAAGDSSEEDFSNANERYRLQIKSGDYLLYYSMQLFFQNGGGNCYIVSVGNYSDDIDMERFSGGIQQLIKEQEPTMLVIPEAVLLSQGDCYTVQQAMLAHCGEKMKNRIAILDVWEGFKERQAPSGSVANNDTFTKNCIDNFRNGLGINHLDFSAAYYPWIKANIVQEKDLDYTSIDGIVDLLSEEILKPLENDLKQLEGSPITPPPAAPAAEEGDGEAQPEAPTLESDTDPLKATEINQLKERIAQSKKILQQVKSESPASSEGKMLNKMLMQTSPVYKKVIVESKNQLNLMPPSAAIAGVYTMVDNSRGVWKAPANVSLSSVLEPAVSISGDEQEDLNVTPQGKSINAIRTFIGEGTVVWGGRTLDGNSLDWRYINVRRTMIMLEESLKLATKAHVFENNDANTWVTIKSMHSNFLTGIWKRGGLAGASPAEAFSVNVGLGETMTPQDILEGILRVNILVALVRPAEFIEITFQQQMQTS